MNIHTSAWLAFDVKTLLCAAGLVTACPAALQGVQPSTLHTSHRPRTQSLLTLEADLMELRAFSWLAVLVEERLTAQQMDKILIWVSHDLYK